MLALPGGEGTEIAQALLLVLALAGVTAAAAVLTALVSERQPVMSELIAKDATAAVLTVTGRVPLAEFEDARFHDRAVRALSSALTRPAQIVSGLTAILTGVAGLVAVVAVLATIDVLLVAVAAAAVPAWVASRANARTLHRFSLAQTHADRERAYLQHGLSTRNPLHPTTPGVADRMPPGLPARCSRTSRRP